VKQFSASKKNLDNMLLFVSDPEVEKDVKHIRKIFAIPPDGFGSPAKYDQWMSGLAVEYGKMITHDERDLSAFIRFMRAMSTLGKGLPENFARYLRDHVLYGETNAPLQNFAIVPTDGGLEPGTLNVKIYATLTDEEWAELKKMVTLMGAHLPKYRPLKDVERKLAREKKVRDIQEYNKQEDREYRATYGEAVGEGVAKQARENIRELTDLRKQRFGKK
jgi:hypothetical protein